jgi:hypothetical protein
VADTDAQFEVVRKAFEDTMRTHYPIWSFASDGCGGYHNERTELAWQGWMACFMRMTSAGVQEVPRG